MAPGAGPTNEESKEGGQKVSTWLIVGAVVLVLALAFWFYDATGADVTGNETDRTTDEETGGESPDNFLEPSDGEGPDVEPTPPSPGG